MKYKSCDRVPSAMDIDPVSQSYTILRIKRKRNEEPLDALGTLPPPRYPTH
jgi:hypothetical protein